MKILVLNCGSSSIKFQLINMEEESVLAEGIVERIGETTALYTYKSEAYTKKKREMLIEDHKEGIKLILENLMDETHGVVKNVNEISAIGHRLVHAGEFYSDAVKINDDVMAKLKECCVLAPLHNPANIMGVEAVKAVMPNTPQCGVFDTAFHQTMPPKAYLYPLPLDFYTQHKIRRYGFHGTSHKYVSLKAAEYLNKDIKDLKIITCHIGNGASITAINKGESIDTSMGFTPLEGLMMGTRCGDIDPAIPIHLVKQLSYTIDEVNNILNKQSGMLGLSHISNDMREIEEEILEKKEQKAIQAHDVYAYRIKKYIGSYIAALNGVDVLIFTGGVGEKMPILRELVLQDMDYLGLKLNLENNKIFNDEIVDLSAKDSKVKILKVPTNEELMIAIETKEIITKS
ncbi:MAG: acetate kinase [Candidatus Cloacimonetes bacterium]|jgi:acetate kinase|nr:acetate kinase [Candidatus Cloacimonadota bacterium]